MQTPTADSSWAQWGERLQRIEDERAIERLKQDYADACDRNYDLDRLSAVFTPNALWSSNGYGDFTGHAQIRTFFAGMATQVVEAMHYISSPRIDIDAGGQRARAQFYLLCLCRSRHPKDAQRIDPVVIVGRYDDRLVKVDGRWLFESMRVEVRSTRRLREPAPRST